MEMESIKQLILRYWKWIKNIGTLLSIGVPASVWYKNNKTDSWFYFIIGLLLVLLFNLFSKWVKKVSQCRNQQQIFRHTHNTWHQHKQLADKMMFENTLEISDVHMEVVNRIHSILNSFKQSLKLLHPGVSMNYSIKRISYTVDDLDKINGSNFLNYPFSLTEAHRFRDRSETSPSSENKHQVLEFSGDETSADFRDLKKTLFYQAMSTKDIAWVSRFSDIQKKYTKSHCSGLVAPVIINDIPISLICIGTPSASIFSGEDREISATFVDCLAEFLRLEIILRAIIKTKKVLFFENWDDLLKLIERKGSQDDQNRLESG